MTSRPSARAALHLFWCGVLLSGLAMMVLPGHQCEVSARIAAHRSEIVAIANLTLAAGGLQRSSSDSRGRECRPREEVGEARLVAEGIDPVGLLDLVALPARSELLSAPPVFLPRHLSPGWYRTGTQRSRAPPT